MPIEQAEISRRVEGMLANPRFAEARQASIDGYLAVYSDEPALNKLLVEGARHVIFTFVLCLAAAQRDEDPSTWLTLGALQDVVAAHQVGSPGLVEAIVTRMLDRGLLTSTPAPSDRRKRILAPTEALIEHDLDLLAAQALPCSILEPKRPLDLMLARDRTMQLASRRVSAHVFGEAMALLAAHPEMMLFIGRDSGYLALLEVLASALASPEGNRSTVTYQAVADRFGVSRTHVRDLWADAEAAGLVRLGARGGGEIEVLPALMQHFDRWLASAMELFDRVAQQAHEAMEPRG